MKATVNFDGGGQHTGRTVAAATVKYADGSVGLVARTFKSGEGTHNTAEYQALILGLTTAYENGVTEVLVFGDSKLVVEQVNGRWKVKDDRLRSLCADARAWLARFDSWAVTHVRREDNTYADQLGRLALREEGP
jgi:ribonuclease HI